MLHSLPAASRTRLAIRLYPRAERAVRRGHPWVFAQGIKDQRHEGRPGDLAVLFDANNQFLAIGLYDPASPIRVRVLHQGNPETIDPEWFAGRIRKANERRRPLLSQDTTGYRIVHGENDQMPGLVVDRYGGSLVVKLYTAAWIPYLRTVMEGIRELLDPGRVVLRLSRVLQKQRENLYGLYDGQTLHGSSAEEAVMFRENGLLFEADLIHGQKTGFFLDQRDNRMRVERLSSGRSVLNVFAYTGGFSVYAARGGAERVTSLDLSGPALAAAERNFDHNRHLEGIDPERHDLMQGDAFESLEELGRRGELFDLVVLDPPAFAKSQTEIARAVRTYQRLTRSGLRVLRPGGVLVAASCSSRVGAEQFANAVTEAAQQAGRLLHVIEQTGHPLDHPIGFKDGAYLRCMFATAG